MIKFLQEMAVQEAAGDVVAMKVSEIQSFNQEIFKPYEGARLLEMVESVRAYGIITPIIVRDIGDKFEILSGHNRVLAAREVGLETVPALVRKDVSEDEARFIVTESNVNQRGFMELSIIERAHCIAVRYEAMKSQGLRMDVIREIMNDVDDIGEESLDTGEIVAESFDLSARNVRRYVRLHQLVPELKELIDREKIGISSGVVLSYLASDNQKLVGELASENNVKISIKDACEIRQLEKAGELDSETLEKILVTSDGVKRLKVTLGEEVIDKYFDGFSEEEIYEVLERALDLWFSKEGIAS